MPAYEESLVVPRRCRTILGRFLLVLGSIAAALLIGEEITRVVAPQRCGVPFAEEIDGITCGLRNTHGRLFVPGAFDVTISVNSQHFRGRKEYTPEPAPNVFRIATLGDSFTFGWGANDDETWPARLEQILASSLGPRRVEVINAGSPGLGPGEESLFYEIWVKRYHPKLVILGLHVNDPGDEVRRQFFVLNRSGGASPRPLAEIAAAGRQRRWVRQAFYTFPGFAYLAQHSQLFNLLRRVASAELQRAEAPPTVDSEVSREHYLKLGIPLVAGEVIWLHRRIQESGASLVVVFLPARERIYPFPESWKQFVETRTWMYGELIESLSDVCSREGIPFLDLSPRVQQQAQQLSQPFFYFVGTETHPNPTGYRVFAGAIADFLLGQGLIARERNEETLRNP